MASNGVNGDASADLLKEILGELKSLKQENVKLASSVDEINGRVNILAGVKQVKAQGGISSPSLKPMPKAASETPSLSVDGVKEVSEQYQAVPSSPEPAAPRRASLTSKIILTSYPNQAGVDPCPMNWGDKDPAKRGPVVVSRHPSTIRRRNGNADARHVVACSELTGRSDWSSWRLLLHLSCPCGGKQEPGH